MTAALLPYRRALERVVATGRRTARDVLGVRLPPVHLALCVVAVEAPRLVAVPPDRIELAIAEIGQLRPPPEGATTLYGVCHEVAHLVAARALGRTDALPVVWDEALAHLLAVDVLLPAVHASHGPRLWPDPYPDYLSRERQLPTDSDGRHPQQVAVLMRTTAELRRAGGTIGYAALLQQLAELPAPRRQVTTLGPALRQAVRARTGAGETIGRALGGDG